MKPKDRLGIHTTIALLLVQAILHTDNVQMHTTVAQRRMLYEET